MACIYGRGPKLKNEHSDCSRSASNRFVGSKNVGFVYTHSIVDKLQKFHIFVKNSHGHEKGVATLGFPCTMENKKIFWC